ncbi:Hsp20/alpha crystallin family protein [Rhodococcus qingshengii]|uniref:Hsp20/alpha crystallin family protein n=1 Tax=Rhodococcus qingshengii TaxID=334542 RepID=UPI0024BA9548|nr:Hsp20/alpha crystallin family protein [Rhodococcus qingshengii]MDJ0489686.1 Hsp20/alpha crystallin family protein [Rhodococcus qingshengii]
MNILSPRHPRQSSAWPTLPDWSDLMARFESMPPWTSLEGHMIRVEEHLDKGRYTLRAELPGVDPEKDVEISVRDGQLTIKAERIEQDREGTRSEFRYGSFYRSMPLPVGAKEDDINAAYADGILTVTMPVAESPTSEKRIEITKTAAGNGHH